MADAAPLSVWRLAFLSGTFFLGMTLMEIVLEGAMRRFSHPGAVGLLVTLAQFAGCSLLALLLGGGSQVSSSSSQGSREAGSGILALVRGWLPYLGLSCLIWCGTGLANVAVSWVQYPVKVVFKSSKLIPTMGVSVVMGNSGAFGAVEYLAAICLCAGAAGFSLHAGKGGEAPQLVLLGIAFLTCSMFCDALSANTQQQLMQKTKVPPMAMMLRLNFCGALVSMAIIAASGQMRVVFELLAKEPLVVAYMAGVGGCMAVGVWANTVLIKEAGSVMAVGVATVRKVVTMILSYMIYRKPFRIEHVFAFALMVVGLLLAESTRLESKRPESKEKSEKTKLTEDSGNDRLAGRV